MFVLAGDAAVAGGYPGEAWDVVAVGVGEGLGFFAWLGVEGEDADPVEGGLAVGEGLGESGEGLEAAGGADQGFGGVGGEVEAGRDPVGEGAGAVGFCHSAGVELVDEFALAGPDPRNQKLQFHQFPFQGVGRDPIVRLHQSTTAHTPNITPRCDT